MKKKVLKPVNVTFTEDTVNVELSDGRILSNPLKWHPWLEKATPEQKANVELWIFSVWWPDLDEGLDLEGMLLNIPSDKSFLNETERGDKSD